MIESLEALGQSRIQECAPIAIRAFWNAVRPIYGLKGDRLTHIGSSILLDIDGRRVISTAAHIVDNLAHSPLFVGGVVGSGPVQIKGRVRTTMPPNGERAQDHFDCAYCEIDSEDAAALGSVEFLELSRISHNRAPSPGRAYTAFGYAISRNKNRINHGMRTIENRLSAYTGHLVEAPALAAELPRNGEDHLILNFERQAYTESGERINAFGPRGLSGGPLIDLGDFTSPANYAPDRRPTPLLSGMMIEHHRQHDAILAVKIGTIVNGIRKALSK